MKKTKKLLVLCMTITLFLCTVMPTFSWYNRAGSLPEDSAKGAGKIEYEATVTGAGYNSEITLETYKGSVEDGINVVYDTTTKLNSFAGTIEADSADYYKTVIRNSSLSKSAKVNLFLKNFSLTSGGVMSDKLFVGCTNPVYNKQAYSPKSSTEKSSNNTIRIYFQPKDVWDRETEFFLFYYDAITSREGITMTACPTVTDYQTYYADIPLNCSGFFITCDPKKDSKGKVVKDENGVTVGNQHATGNKRTPSIKLSEISHLGGYVIGLPGGLVEYDNVKYEIYKGAKTCNVKEYYSKLYGNVGYTGADVALTSNAYTGKTISYKSNNTSIATVDSGGKVNIVGNGNTTITTTITGVYGDTMKFETAVEAVDSKEQIPIVENIVINAKGETEVCWFIKNDTGSKVEYTVSKVSTSL